VLPDREPDYISGYWHFFFKEMIQWNSQDKCSYKIKESDEKIMFFSRKYQKWLCYDLYFQKDIYGAYLNWQIDNLLLE
jgi:hypothetical protein